MKHNYFLMVLVLVLAMILVACPQPTGGDPTGDTDTSGDSTTDTDDTNDDPASTLPGDLSISTNVGYDSTVGWLGYADITITDGSGVEVASGTTDTNGDYSVSDLDAGDYTVDVSYDSQFGSTAETDSAVVTVVGEQTVTQDFALNIPVEVIESSVYTETIANQIGTSYIVPFTIVDEGTYHFETSESTDAVDTLIAIKDIAGNQLDYNDDGPRPEDGAYSFVRLYLAPGDYEAIIEKRSDTAPWGAIFEMSSVETIY